MYSFPVGLAGSDAFVEIQLIPRRRNSAFPIADWTPRLASLASADEVYRLDFRLLQNPSCQVTKLSDLAIDLRACQGNCMNWVLFSRENLFQQVAIPACHQAFAPDVDNGIEYWRRPGKTERGTSATVNYEGSGVFYVFSTAADPFEELTGYSKFHAHVLLNHNGDFKAAAKALARRGYGRPCRRRHRRVSRTERNRGCRDRRQRARVRR